MFKKTLIVLLALICTSIFAQEYNLQLTSIEDGQAVLLYDNKRITLKQGEQEQSLKLININANSVIVRIGNREIRKLTIPKESLLKTEVFTSTSTKQYYNYDDEKTRLIRKQQNTILELEKRLTKHNNSNKINLNPTPTYSYNNKSRFIMSPSSYGMYYVYLHANNKKIVAMFDTGATLGHHE